MKPSQQPTCTNLRIRSTLDANVLFHAVAINILPIVTRRLDAADRAALAPGCVYVWEERAPASDEAGVGMERFTEGRHWHPSRVRDDFLLYLEKDSALDASITQAELSRRRCQASAGKSLLSYDQHSYQPRPRPQLIKQTYSAWVNGSKGLRKWHINAYYTEDSLNYLRTVDDIPVLAKLHVPHDRYKRARTSKIRESDPSRMNRGPSSDERSSSPSSSRSAAQHTYTAYLSQPPHHPQTPHHPHAFSPIASSADRSPDHINGFKLVPLDHLSHHISPRRERIDDEVLRSFRHP